MVVRHGGAPASKTRVCGGSSADLGSTPRPRIRRGQGKKQIMGSFNQPDIKPSARRQSSAVSTPRQAVLFGGAEPMARARARWSHPPTSHEAARSVVSIRESQKFILSVLQVDGPLTDEELFAAVTRRGRRISPSGCRTRGNELCKAGFVCDSGKRRRLPSGRWSVVWAATGVER